MAFRALGLTQTKASMEGREDVADGESLNLQGTPSFVVGPTGGEMEVVNTDNGLTYETISRPIDRLLAQQR